MSVHTVLFAQSDISSKLSIETQIFLNDRDITNAMHRKIPAAKKASAWNQTEALQGNHDDGDRIYTAPEVHNGVSYISAFIRVKDDSKIYELETKGVCVRCKFKNGIMTAHIPVDSVEAVANLSNVEKIEIATPMHVFSDVARSTTNAIDVLTQSQDAIDAGIKEKYDGRGIILAVIDQGIDFRHIAFKDKNNKTRIKLAYIYDDKKTVKIITDVDADKPETDNAGLDHGTQTASIAGGSSVVINGNSVTVTEEHANATYGGVAPGTDLCLCGISDLSTNYISEAIKCLCDYADSVGKPIVLSNSWGNANGFRDGGGLFAGTIGDYFGDEHPNHICLFASSNYAGNIYKGGGCYISGNSSKSNPLGTVFRTRVYSEEDKRYIYNGDMASAIMRHSANNGYLACKILVLDTQGNIMTSETVIGDSDGIKCVSGLNDYYDGELDVNIYQEGDFDKCSIAAIDFKSKYYADTYTIDENGNIVYQNNYMLAVQFFPTQGSNKIEAWGTENFFFINQPSTPDCIWTNGTVKSSISNEAANPNVISVGAYVSKNNVTDYKGETHSCADKNKIGDIASYSGYQEAGIGIRGEQFPWITAPGSTVIAGVNHYHTKDGYIDDYYAKDREYRVNTNINYPYGNMYGTSAATPIAAGIVALWLQAATELGLSLTTSDVKNIMKYTAIKDKFTNGKNASHFGNGKIDALAGIKAIVDPELAIKHDDYYNKLFVNFKTFVCPCTVSVSCLNDLYPKEVAREIIKNYNDTLTFNTDYWERGDYYIEIKYGNKTITDTVMLNHVGRQPKLDAHIKGEYIVVNFKFSGNNKEGELKMFRASEFYKKGFNSSPIYSDKVDITDYGDYLIEKKYYNTNDIVFALFENGRCVAMTTIGSSSNVFASIHQNQHELNVMYQIPSLGKDSYIEISKKIKSDVKLALKDVVHTNGNNIDGTIRRYVDSEESEFGSEMFDCTDWEDGDYIVSLCQNGKEMTKTDIHISRCSAIKMVVKDDNSVNITYDLGKEAKTAYVVVTDIDGTMRYVKKLSLSSTNCSIEGNFRDCKFVNVLLYVDGVLVSSDKY